MTPAEKSALALEHTTPFVDEDYAVFSQSAALIRRLAAALVDADELIYQYTPKSVSITTRWEQRHADALWDIREG